MKLILKILALNQQQQNQAKIISRQIQTLPALELFQAIVQRTLQQALNLRKSSRQARVRNQLPLRLKVNNTWPTKQLRIISLS